MVLNSDSPSPVCFTPNQMNRLSEELCPKAATRLTVTTWLPTQHCLSTSSPWPGKTSSFLPLPSSSVNQYLTPPLDRPSPKCWIILDLSSSLAVSNSGQVHLPCCALHVLNGKQNTEEATHKIMQFYLYPGLVEKLLVEVREQILWMFACPHISIVMHLTLWFRNITNDRSLVTFMLKFLNYTFWLTTQNS